MKDILSEVIQRIGGVLPFLLSVNGKPKVNWMRVIEFAFLGGVIYATTHARLESLDYQIREMRAEWQRDRAELIADIRKFREDLYTPAGKRDHWGFRPGKTER